MAIFPGSLIASGAQTASAHHLAAEQVMRFAIPAQRLTGAIEAYARQTGVQILYDTPVDPATMSPGVSGTMVPSLALDRLLVGTGLLASPAEAGAVVLVRIPKPDARRGAAGDPITHPWENTGLVLVLDTVHVAVPPPVHPALAYRFYATIIQSGLVSALRKNAATGARRYSVKLELLIGSQGQITGATSLSTTGDAALDAAVQRVVLGTILASPPPKAMPQPVRIKVDVGDS